MGALKKAMVLAFGTALMSGTAYAGQAAPVTVDVDLDINFANGDMITAFSDKDDDVFIGCGTRNFDDGAGGIFARAFCQAEDADGDRAVCFTTNPELVASVRAINYNSYVQFAWNDDGSGNLECYHMGFSTQSFYQDKHAMSTAVGGGK